MKHSARPRHYNDLAESSKRAYQYSWRAYADAAARAGQPLYAPDPQWLEAFLEREMMISVSRVQRRMCALAYKFWEQGLPNPTTDLPILRVLHARFRGQRAAREEILGLLPAKAKSYASYLLDGQYARSTLQHRAECGQAWELWAKLNGADPQHPQPEDMLRYLHRFDDRAFSTLTNRVEHLSHYFEDRRLPDATRAPEVELFLETQRRRPSQLRKPLYLDDVRRIVSVFVAEDTKDKRDHFLTLLAFFGAMHATDLAKLEWKDVRELPDGLEVTLAGRSIFLDRYEDEPGLDLVAAYRAYCDTVTWRDGRLFRARGLRYDYLERSSPAALGAAITDAAHRAGITGGRIVDRLRDGYRSHAVQCFGTFVAAKLLNLNINTLANYSSAARIEQEQVVGRRVSRRRRGPRTSRTRGKRASR